MKNSKQIVKEIKKRLKAISSREIATCSKKYFKEPINTYGIMTPDVKKISKEYQGLLKNSLDLSLKVAEGLFASNIMEEGQIATDLLVSHLKSFTDFHLNIFDKWIDYLTNWARVDDFSTHVLGPLFIKYPKELRRVFLWTRSKNRWRRRTAPVSLVVPIRKYALFIDEGFEVANHLVLDHDDLIQKGTGWMLREIMGKREKKALKFLKQNKDKVTGTLLSYACEKLPKEKRVYKRSRS